jgi:hypothetical protein
MKLRSTALAFTILAAPLSAQTADSATFIIRLGNDTTAIERYVRTPRQLVAQAVQRSPNTMLHRLVVDFDARGAVTGGEWSVQAPGANQPQTRRTIRFLGDSATIETTQGGTARTQRIRAADAIPIAGPFYSPYELAMMRGSGRSGCGYRDGVAGRESGSHPAAALWPRFHCLEQSVR